jgi:hypothetical protein
MKAPVKKAPEHGLPRKGNARRATERETALDVSALRRELLDGIRALPGLQIDPIR